MIAPTARAALEFPALLATSLYDNVLPLGIFATIERTFSRNGFISRIINGSARKRAASGLMLCPPLSNLRSPHPLDTAPHRRLSGCANRRKLVQDASLATRSADRG